MVRVLSVHHFTSQDVASIGEGVVTSTVAGNKLLVATDLHQINVYDLSDLSSLHSFPTVDLVKKMIFSPIGAYLLTLETRDDMCHVRVYRNWDLAAAVQEPMQARIAAVTPGHSREDKCFEMIEIVGPGLPADISLCDTTGNLVILKNRALTIYKYTLVNHQTTNQKFIDFQECMTISLNYQPTEVRLVEDMIGCLTPSLCHVFKVKVEEASEENKLRSLSMYSFSSESECSSISSPVKVDPGQASKIKLVNVTERRSLKSNCENEIDPPSIRNHPNHIELKERVGDGENSYYAGIDVIPNSTLEKEARELGSLSSPNILEQVVGPCPTPSYLQVEVNLQQAAFAQAQCQLQGTAITLVAARISGSERSGETLRLLRLHPVYWREYRVRRNRKPGSSAGGASGSSPHNPLQSLMSSHLMSVSLMFASTHEGYLYHIPGHIRRAGRGVGVKKIGTYPFTSPVNNLVLEPSLVHALTDTGLETYTLRSGYHTVREAQTVDDVNITCPPNSTPICLIGLRPFLGVQNLLLSADRLVLLSSPSASESPRTPTSTTSKDPAWTAYSLHIPSSLTLYQDMVTVAEMNAGTPHGHLQLLCEAHMVLRSSLHRLTWLQVMRQPHGPSEVRQPDIDEVRTAYHESCRKLADHYLTYDDDRLKYSLALPYYRMSGASVMSVLTGFKCASPLQPGIRFYIEEIVQRPSTVHAESLLDSGVADKIIEILGEYSLSTLVSLILTSPTLRGFKSKRSLEYITEELRHLDSDFEPDASTVLAAVLVGGADAWLAMVQPVALSKVLLDRYVLLFDTSEALGGQCLSELALVLRNSLPIVFCEVCVSLIESEVISLGHLLNLILQTFMAVPSTTSSAASSTTATLDNASFLQLFLETYFVEFCASNKVVGNADTESLPLTGDQKQGLDTLIRSYLASLSKNAGQSAAAALEPGVKYEARHCFAPRHEYLDQLPPIIDGNTSGEVNHRSTEALLKLQSLLCSRFCDESNKEIVQRFLTDHPNLEGELSLRVLTSKDVQATVKLLFHKVPGSLISYCKSSGNDPRAWAAAINLLYSIKTEASEVEMMKLVGEMSSVFPPDRLMEILPPDQLFQDTLIQSRKHVQAERLQQLIVSYSIVAKP